MVLTFMIKQDLCSVFTILTCTLSPLAVIWGARASTSLWKMLCSSTSFSTLGKSWPNPLLFRLSWETLQTSTHFFFCSWASSHINRYEKRLFSFKTKNWELELQWPDYCSAEMYIELWWWRWHFNVFIGLQCKLQLAFWNDHNIAHPSIKCCPRPFPVIQTRHDLWLFYLQ